MAEDEGSARGASAGAAGHAAQVSLGPIAEAANDPIFLTLADAISDNLILLDRDGRVQYINYTVPDLSVAQVIGTLVYDYVPAEYREVMRRCHERVLESGQPGRYETTYVSGDGETSLWESRVSPVVRDGAVVGLVQLASNVTERRQAAADRDRLFNLSLDMLCVAGLDGYFKRVNPAFEQTLGHSEADLLSTPFFDFVHPEDRERTRDAVARLGHGEVVLDFENRYRCRDGSYRWISWRGSTDAGGQIVAVGRDVTQRRELEHQLRESQKLQAVGQLAGGIAHDFNNLVLAIDLNTQLARVTRDEAPRLQHLDEISRAAKRAADLTRQLLAFARRQPATLLPVDLNAALEGMSSMLRRLIPENIEIRFSAAPGLAPVLADSTQLEQVVMNLCLNARDAMPDGGVLTLETCAGEGAWIRLRVQDTGTGIAPEVRDRIFEPFFTTKPQGLGTGLGLATAYGIVEQHGGRIDVQSELGHGSTFVVELPASDALLARHEQRNASESTRASGTETVLVAEDEPGVRRALVGFLTQAGYHVLVANDGEQALELFEHHGSEIDLLLFDVVMPRLSGPAAVQRIRERRPGIPVVFISGYTADHDPALASIPRSRTTAKPFEAAALLAVLRAALAEPR